MRRGRSETEGSMTIRFSLLLAAVLAFCAVAADASAQQVPNMHRIGFLSVYAEKDPGSQRWQASFRRGLQDHGWTEGRNISIHHRWIRGRRDCEINGRRACLPKLVDELLALKVELIVVHGGAPARVIQQRAPALPVVMAEASDAIGRGIVKSLAKPGGSITGLTSITPVLAAKRLELLKEIVPGLSRVGVIWTPNAPASSYAWQQIKEPARRLGLDVISVRLRPGDDLEKPFRDAARSGAGALIDTSGVGSTFGKRRIADLANRTGLPAIFIDAENVHEGGLMSYNRDNNDLYRRAAAYVDKILKGAKPADLPIEQPTRFYLRVNLKTAKALGITIPPAILLRADEVVE